MSDLPIDIINETIANHYSDLKPPRIESIFEADDSIQLEIEARLIDQFNSASPNSTDSELCANRDVAQAQLKSQAKGTELNEASCEALLKDPRALFSKEIVLSDRYARYQEECNQCQGWSAKTCPVCNSTGQTQCEQCHGSKIKPREDRCSVCDDQGGGRCYQCGATGEVSYAAPCGCCSGSGKKEVTETCNHCRGVGRLSCTRCGDRGRIACYSCNGRGVVTGWVSGETTTCPSCSGRGDTYCDSCGGHARHCSTCGASGQLIRSESCDYCRGSGQIETVGTCPTCQGNVYLTCRVCGTKSAKSMPEPACVICKGKGNVACSTCNGLSKGKCRNCDGLGYSAKGLVLQQRLKLIASSIDIQAGCVEADVRARLMQYAMSHISSEDLVGKEFSEQSVRLVYSIPCALVIAKVTDCFFRNDFLVLFDRLTEEVDGLDTLVARSGQQREALTEAECATERARLAAEKARMETERARIVRDEINACREKAQLELERQNRKSVLFRDYSMVIAQLEQASSLGHGISQREVSSLTSQDKNNKKLLKRYVLRSLLLIAVALTCYVEYSTHYFRGLVAKAVHSDKTSNPASFSELRKSLKKLPFDTQALQVLEEFEPIAKRAVSENTKDLDEIARMFLDLGPRTVIKSPAVMGVLDQYSGSGKFVFWIEERLRDFSRTHGDYKNTVDQFLNMLRTPSLLPAQLKLGEAYALACGTSKDDCLTGIDYFLRAYRDFGQSAVLSTVNHRDSKAIFPLAERLASAYTSVKDFDNAVRWWHRVLAQDGKSQMKARIELIKIYGFELRDCNRANNLKYSGGNPIPPEIRNIPVCQ